MLCDAMRFNHLPEAGGIYDQNPRLISRFYYILAQRNKAQNEEHERQRREAESKGKGRRFGRSR